MTGNNDGNGNRTVFRPSPLQGLKQGQTNPPQGQSPLGPPVAPQQPGQPGGGFGSPFGAPPAAPVDNSGWASAPAAPVNPAPSVRPEPGSSPRQ